MAKHSQVSLIGMALGSLNWTLPVGRTFRHVPSCDLSALPYSLSFILICSVVDPFSLLDLLTASNPVYYQVFLDHNNQKRASILPSALCMKRTTRCCRPCAHDVCVSCPSLRLKQAPELPSTGGTSLAKNSWRVQASGRMNLGCMCRPNDLGSATLVVLHPEVSQRRSACCITIVQDLSWQSIRMRFRIFILTMSANAGTTTLSSAIRLAHK